MKKFLLFITPLLFLNCTDAPPVLFEIQTQSRIVIPAGLDNFRTHTFFLNNIPTRVSSEPNAANPDLLGQIVPTRAVIQSPFFGFDFTTVNMIVINIWDPALPDEKKEVFYMDRQNNRNRQELQLFSSLSEVKNILLNDEFSAEVKFNFSNFTNTELDFELTMNFVANGEQ